MGDGKLQFQGFTRGLELELYNMVFKNRKITLLMRLIKKLLLVIIVLE